MMKNIAKKFVSILCAALLVLPLFLFAACDKDDTDGGDKKPNGGNNAEHVDYVDQLKLDLNSSTKKQEVKIKILVDGDTTHFDPINSNLTGYNPADFEGTYGYIKARYLAINTPESTGKIEKWGKTASNFTKEKLEHASKIIVESDTDTWNLDSTGGRYTLWVWYLPEGVEQADATDTSGFRNLNVEILQNGLALASSTATAKPYGATAQSALNQAMAEQLHLYSNDTDPNFYEGPAVQISLKELRCNVKDYLQQSVCVTGVISACYSQTVYIEEYDELTDMYYGMAVYYGYQATPQTLKALSVGNEVNVVGSVTEFQGTYQISGVKADPFAETEEEKAMNTFVIGEAGSHEGAFQEITADQLANGTVDVKFADEEGIVDESKTKTIPFGDAVMCTSVTLKNLTITEIYTTKTGASAGAMTLTCVDANGKKVEVRTEKLYANGVDGALLTAESFFDNPSTEWTKSGNGTVTTGAGKTITVIGIVDYYDGNYQISVWHKDCITVL